MKINWLEIKRKIWHILWGVLIYFLILSTDKIIYQSLMMILLIFGVIVKILMHYKVNMSWVEWLIKKIGRKDEGIEAAFYFVLSIFVSSIFFEQRIVALSALTLGVCDGVATIFGIHGKNRLFRKKTVEGTTAFFISCFLIIYLSGFSKITALITGIILSIVELTTDINDNLIIPPVFSSLIKIFS